MKAVKLIVIIVLFLVIAGGVAFQIFFRRPIPEYSGTIEVQGLQKKVEVRTDKHGIPHIYAENDADLFFAQGYITARERMFQMDVSRLAGRGELSTLFGEVTIGKDRFLKTVGFYRKAKSAYKTLPGETRDIIEAYTRGVNAYIKTANPLPREYFFLKTSPEPWEPEDSVVIGLIMSYSLTRSKKVDLVLYQIGKAAGLDKLEKIIPSYPDFAPTLNMAETGPMLKPSFQTVSNPVFDKEFYNNHSPVLPWLKELPASNWMIFSGKRTTTGKAIFAGSPDLEPTLPALFYMMHIQGGTFDVSGGNLPGFPGIGPLGFNGAIAWSAVNGRGDELDYFIEKINPDNSNQYLTENGYRNFDIIEETLKVKTKDGIQQEKIEIKISRHGPVISDVLPLAPKNCAMKWVALESEALDFHGFLLMNRAKNFDEFRHALSYIRSMNLNMGYADINGNIGWQFTASPPIRKKGDGSLPVPGWTGEYEWKGYIPFEDIPYDYNPEKGYTASFNNDPGNVSFHLTNYYLFERAIRFREIMDARGDKKINLDDVFDMQLDTVSVVAERWVPYIVQACEGIEAFSPYVKLFDNWNFSIDTESAAATLFNAFYLKLMGNTLKDDVGEELWENQLAQSYLYYIPDLLLAKIIEDKENHFFDDISTQSKKENRDDIIHQSMKDAIKQLTDMLGENPESWQWGNVHKMYFKHPLGSKLPFLNLKPISTQGSHHTINSGFWDPANPFKMNAGGVIRMVVDFSNIDNATIISPPGQSGHYLSPFYDDLAHTWAEGRQIPMNYLSGKEIPVVLFLTP
ncbi:MAG: penicillin acylase family protein [Deltaproteobacteria bacterium]|nr:penicillin acylase family protein [Deltaproteobacteria bacterium]